MKDTLLTPKEVAEYLRIDLRTLYRLTKKGFIPALKIGRQWRYKEEVIESLGSGHLINESSRDSE
jgi:excisionase family DNA binding protein